MALNLNFPPIQITLRAPNIGNVNTADATGHIELPRTWYATLKAQPTTLDYARLGYTVMKSLQAIENAGLVRTLPHEGILRSWTPAGA